MKKIAFKYPSADGRTQIHAIVWKPDQGEITGILQISHGMIEYVERYEPFAEYLTEKGFVVAGNDHLGHGLSVVSQDDWGFFAPEKGSDLVVEDLNSLRRRMQKEYQDIPYFMLGHSMGSFLLRKYLSKYGRGLAGAIIMGTGTQKTVTVAAGKALCRFLALFKGWHYRSPLVDQQVFSGNNKRFQAGSTDSWLTKDAEIVKAYNSNPCCTFKFTLNGFYNLFDTIHFINRKGNIQSIPRDLPMFFVSGEDDPVGNYGTGVKTAFDTYRKAGIKDITWKLYSGDRHEILNETDKEIVYEDIYKWLRKHL